MMLLWRKIGKRAFSLVMAFLVCAGMCGVNCLAEAADAVPAEENLTIVWDEDAGLLTVTGTGTIGRDTVVAVQEENNVTVADIRYGRLKHLVLEGAVTIADGSGSTASTGVFAPYEKDNAPLHETGKLALESVVIRGGENGCAKIGALAFCDCKGLRSLVLEGIESIGSRAFLRCENLSSALVLRDVETIGGSAFQNCAMLPSVSLTNIGSIENDVFSGCSGMKTAELSDVAKLGVSAFRYCHQLSSVTLDNVAFAAASSKGYAPFQETGKTASDGLTVTVTDSEIAGYAFSGSFLKTVSLTDTAVAKYAFRECSQLETVSMMNSPAGQYAFYKCSALKTVSLTDTAVATYAFRECSQLETVSMTDSSVAQYAFWKCNALKTVTATGSSRIDGSAFVFCDNLNNVSVESGTKLGYLNNFLYFTDKIAGISDRVTGILKDQFALDPAPDIRRLPGFVDTTGWDDTKIGGSSDWQRYGASQVMEQARWVEGTGWTVAEVQADVYYTAKAQMDYIFVLDLSNSMTSLGNDADSNARFYDMQSKLLDVTAKLLQSGDYYDCKTAMVTFGGYNSASYPGKSEMLPFTDSAKEAEDFLWSLRPYYENTDYGLGLKNALTLAEENKAAGRNTTLVFLSDGMPHITDVTKSSGDYTGEETARQIRELGVEIYGVLQSVPESELPAATKAIQGICTDGRFFPASCTKEFSDAVNAAITAVYGDYTLTLPVNDDFEDVHDLTVTSGQAVYDEETRTITWTVKGMPFTRHTLTFREILKEEKAGLSGEYAYDTNADDAVLSGSVLGDSHVETPVLRRALYTLTVHYVYEDGSRAADTVTDILAGGTDYAVSSPVLDGYIASQLMVSGVMPNEDREYTILYTAPEEPDDNDTPPEEPGEEEELPDDTPPLSDSPAAEPPVAEPPVAEPPVVKPPVAPVPVDEEIDEPSIPLADVPKTGDTAVPWTNLALLCALCLTGMALTGKGRKSEEA